MSDDPDRMDRTTVRVYTRGEEPSDLDYWRSQPIEDRIAAVWSITRSAWAVKDSVSDDDSTDAESPLPRFIVRVRRRER